MDPQLHQQYLEMLEMKMLWSYPGLLSQKLWNGAQYSTFQLEILIHVKV